MRTLTKEYNEVKELFLKIDSDKKRIKDDEKHLKKLIKELNEARHKRVLELLVNDGKEICLLHREVFPYSKPSEWLVQKERIVPVVINTRSERHYDQGRGEDVGGEKRYDQDRGEYYYITKSEQFSSYACNRCIKNINRGGRVGYNWRELTSAKEEKNRRALLPDKSILDEILYQYYQIPPIVYSDLCSEHIEVKGLD